MTMTATMLSLVRLDPLRRAHVLGFNHYLLQHHLLLLLPVNILELDPVK